MTAEAVMLTVACVLFVQMGLSNAIQDFLGFRLRVLMCPKCCTFWSVLACSTLQHRGLVESVTASFLCAYAALWLAIFYDYAALKYNKLYEKIHPETSTEKDAADPDESQAGDPDEVP